VVAGLLISGGTSAIQTAMVIGALPFSVVMALMAIALLKAIYNDTRREKAGVPTTFDKIEGATGNGIPSGLPAE
jgi:choline-glycine betaine transporter